MDKNSNKLPNTQLPGNPMRSLLPWVMIISLVLLTSYMLTNRSKPYKEISLEPQFYGLVDKNQIKNCEIVYDMSGSTPFVQGEIKDSAVKKGDLPKYFKVNIANVEDISKLLRDKGIPHKVPKKNTIMWNILTSVLPVILVFVIIYIFFIRQIKSAGTGAMNFGRSRAKMLVRDKNKITFKDVEGIEEAKEEVEEIIDFLKAPDKFQKLGGRIPKGVLLMGPPGTGKTLLAKAIAGEADVPFFSISGSDFVEMFVGVGASRVRDMFLQARKNAPCIIFIDEIDAVGRSRFTGIGGGHDEREQTLNALLVEMDGFETKEGIIIIAATNRPDVLDPALLRPGRFDRQIAIDLPMIDGREQILKLHARRIKLSESADLRRVARGTPGFSGADLENLLNEAALLAARANKDAVDNDDLEEARDKVRWGREKRGHVMDDTEKRITAYHESGHALVSIKQEHADPVHKVTIIPRGMAYLGATMSLPEKDMFMNSKKKLLSQLVQLMAGRVAEEIACDDISTGAAGDFKEASKLARLMVCTFGMNKSLGPQSFSTGSDQELTFLGKGITKSQNYSEKTAELIDEEVTTLLFNAYEEAKTIIKENKDKLDLLATTLLKEETISGELAEEIVKTGKSPILEQANSNKSETEEK